MSLSKARSFLHSEKSLLHSEKSLLHPFVIVINGIPMKIYGDIPTMMTRMGIELPSPGPPWSLTTKEPFPPYHTLTFNNIPDGIPLSAFLYVWYYLNGLDDDTSLIDMLEFGSYVIPVPGNDTVPVDPVSLVTPTPIGAYYFLRAFSIPFSEQIWGKWFLGIFQLEPSSNTREILREVLPPRGIPQYFIPPPLCVKGTEPTRANRIDDEITRLLPGTIPPSFLPCLGKEVRFSDLYRKYITSKSPKQLRELHRGEEDEEENYQLLEEPLVCVVDGETMWNIIGYDVIWRDRSKPGRHSSDFDMVFVLHSGDKPRHLTRALPGEPHWKLIGYAGEKGKDDWISVEVFTATSVSIVKCDKIDRRHFIPMEQSYDPTVYNSQAVTFLVGRNESEFTGNPVVMASRSPLMLELLERGLERKMMLGTTLPPVFVGDDFDILWKWLNNEPRHRFQIDVYLPPLRVWLDYFNVSFTSSFYTSMPPGGITPEIIQGHSADDGYKRIRYYNPLVPLSEASTPEVPIPPGVVSKVSLWVPPYTNSVKVPFEVAAIGDIAVFDDVMYRITDTEEDQITVDTSGGTARISSPDEGSWEFTQGRITKEAEEVTFYRSAEAVDEEEELINEALDLDLEE